MEYEYLGEQSVKNIKEPVPVYRVLSFPGEAAHRVIEAKKAVERDKEASSLPGKPSIAVLPFVNISSDPEQEYFVDGLSEEIINSLTQIPNLGVTGRTSSFSFKGSNKKTRHIANELGVENILEGSVSKAGNSLRITTQLICAADDIHLWSKTYDRELKDIFAVQEDIAMAVADELKVTLGVGKSLSQLGGTDNVKAYEYYVIAQGEFAKAGIHPSSHILESLDAALALDPEFAIAWTTKAMRHFQLSNQVPANLVANEHAAGLSAAQRALELEPNLAEAYVALGLYNWGIGHFIETESAIRKAFDLKPELMWGIASTFSLFYLTIGHFKKAYEIFDVTLQNDPLSLPNRSTLITYYNLVGDTKKAEEAYEVARGLAPQQWIQHHFLITLTRLGSKDTMSRDKIPQISLFDPIWSFARDYLESPEDVILELHRYYTNNANLSAFILFTILMWVAYFGDPKFALEVIEKAYNFDVSMVIMFVLMFLFTTPNGNISGL